MALTSELTREERKLLKSLAEKELRHFEDDMSKVRPDYAGFLASEEKYDAFLKKLMKKL